MSIQSGGATPLYLHFPSSWKCNLKVSETRLLFSSRASSSAGSLIDKTFFDIIRHEGDCPDTNGLELHLPVIGAPASCVTVLRIRLD